MEEEKLKADVRKVVKEILAEQKPMPVPAPQTRGVEISIRIGGEVVSLCPPPCCPRGGYIAVFKEKNKDLLQKVQDKTMDSHEDLIDKLEDQIKLQQLAEQLRKYAKGLGIE